MKLKRLIYRSWFYFRIGYSTYLSLPAALFGYATVIYTLFVERFVVLKAILPHFTSFLLWGFLFIMSSGVAFGYLHFKKSSIWKTEQDIQAESHPYLYKSYPGKEKELQLPMQAFNLRVSKKFLTKMGVLSAEDKAQFDYFIELTEKLQRGESV